MSESLILTRSLTAKVYRSCGKGFLASWAPLEPRLQEILDPIVGSYTIALLGTALAAETFSLKGECAMKITQIQFVASLEMGTEILSEVFASLPRKGEEAAWVSQAAAKLFCETFPLERADVGGYYVPSTPETEEEGVTTIITPSSRREVSFFPETNLWTVGFGEGGSIHQAGKVLGALSPECEVTNIATSK